MPRIQVGDVVYEYDPGEITNDDGIAVEKVMNCTFDQWNQKLSDGSMQAMTALVWLLQRKDNPGLRISDVHFKMGDIKPIKEDDEVEDPDNPTVVAELVPGGKTADDPKEPTVDSPVVEEASPIVA